MLTWVRTHDRLFIDLYRSIGFEEFKPPYLARRTNIWRGVEKGNKYESRSRQEKTDRLAIWNLSRISDQPFPDFFLPFIFFLTCISNSNPILLPPPPPFQIQFSQRSIWRKRNVLQIWEEMVWFVSMSSRIFFMALNQHLHISSHRRNLILVA